MTDESLRLDKWLWYARFFKSRSLAGQVCNAGKVRLGGDLVLKAHQKIRVGDVVTFPQGRHIRVVKILALATRRGPAVEAQTLYEDLKPPSEGNRLPREAPKAAGREPGTGRPTKRERRQLDRLREEGS